MDWYTVVKFMHVVCATIWVGGGFMLALAGILANRADDREAMLANLRSTARLGNLVFMPAALLTLVFGVMMCWLWLGFGDAWVLIGLAGYSITFMVGAGLMKPTSDRLTAMIAEQGLDDRALAIGRRMLQIAKFDYTVMLVIVAAMVLKPTMDDLAILIAMAAALAASGLIFLPAWGQPAVAAAA